MDFSIQNLLAYTSDLQNRLNTESNFQMLSETTSYGDKLYVYANRYNKFTLRSNQWPTVQLISSGVADDVLAEYIIEVTCGNVNGTYQSSLGFGDTIKWENGERPSYMDNCVTLIKIANGLGSWKLFKQLN